MRQSSSSQPKKDSATFVMNDLTDLTALAILAFAFVFWPAFIAANRPTAA